MNMSISMNPEVSTDDDKDGEGKSAKNGDGFAALLDLIFPEFDDHLLAWRLLTKICRDNLVPVPTYQEISDANPVYGEACVARLKRNSDEFGEDRTGDVWPYIVRLPGDRAINLRGGYFIK